MSPNPRQGGTAPITTAVGRGDVHLPVGRRGDHRTDLVVLSLVDGAPRDHRAVLSPWDGTAPNPAPLSVGGCLHTAVPSHPCADDPARPRPAGCAPRPPCRLIPVGRHGSHPPRCPLRRRGLETAVSPCPRGTAPDRPHCLWRSGPETAVSPSEGGGGRHGLNCRVARSDPGAARPGPPCRPPCLGRHGSPRPLCTVVRPGPACRPGPLGGAGWRGTTVPAGVHPPAARCPPQPCAPGRISQAITKRCCRPVTLDECSG